LKAAQQLADALGEEVFSDSQIPGYRLASCCSDYAGLRQRWLVIESEKRRESDLKQLKKRLNQQQRQAESELKQLMKQDFACAADALQAAHQLAQSWKELTLEDVEVETYRHYRQAGRPSKNQVPQACTYRVRAQVMRVEEVIQLAQRRAGRFILATNVLEEEILPDDDVLREYKGQQSSERGFGVLVRVPLRRTTARGRTAFLKIPSSLLPVSF
jgi:transposase